MGTPEPNKELITKTELFEKYPNFLSELVWGFECLDGWNDLLDRLCAKITAADPEVKASQVKEKYGTLRFYIDDCKEEAHDAIYEAINDAETESATTCEQCGKPGKISNDGWIMVRCEECKK